MNKKLTWLLLCLTSAVGTTHILAQERTSTNPGDSANALVQKLSAELSNESGNKAPPLIEKGQIVVPITSPLNVNENLGNVVRKVEGKRVMILQGEREVWLERKDVASLEQVEKTLSRMIERGPNEEWKAEVGVFLAARAALRQIMGNHEGAISDCTEVLKELPDCPIAYAVRGRARAAAGQRDAAIEDLTRYLSLDPRSFREWRLRGDLRFDKGDYNGAIADFAEAKQREKQKR